MNATSVVQGQFTVGSRAPKSAMGGEEEPLYCSRYLQKPVNKTARAIEV